MTEAGNERQELDHLDDPVASKKNNLKLKQNKTKRIKIAVNVLMSFLLLLFILGLV